MKIARVDRQKLERIEGAAQDALSLAQGQADDELIAASERLLAALNRQQPSETGTLKIDERGVSDFKRVMAAIFAQKHQVELDALAKVIANHVDPSRYARAAVEAQLIDDLIDIRWEDVDFRPDTQARSSGT